MKTHTEITLKEPSNVFWNITSGTGFSCQVNILISTRSWFDVALTWIQKLSLRLGYGCKMLIWEAVPGSRAGNKTGREESPHKFTIVESVSWSMLCHTSEKCAPELPHLGSKERLPNLSVTGWSVCSWNGEKNVNFPAFVTWFLHG